MANSKNQNYKAKSVVAKSEDGTIQITFTVAFEDILKHRNLVIEELAKDTEVPGFRKGKAPTDRVIEHVSENTILEKTLSKIIPTLFSEAVSENKLNPIIYPRFELVKAKENEDWEIRAVTCETPKIDLGNYKSKITGLSKTSKIWTPDKGLDPKKDTDKVASIEEKEQLVLKALLGSINIIIPRILIEEEANTRLSNLLSRLEKLGLSLESYLSSSNKTAESLRKEYENAAEDGLKLDFTLSKIAEEEKLEVKKEELDIALNVAKDTSHEGHKHEFEDEQRKSFILAILKRRKALDMLMEMAK